jgi:tetratricopeptide (TPR) repeat protein
VLDDLQWAGPDALDLLRVLVQSAPDIPLRLLGAYRDTEVRPDEALSVLLADLAAADLAAQRTLAPLERAAAVQLVDLLLEGVESGGIALRDQVVQRSGGVPFFALSCAQELRGGEREGGVEHGSDSPVRTDLPWSVTQSIRQRVTALSESAQAVLGAAAVIGRATSLHLLVAAVVQPEAEVLSGLDAACAGRLLEETGAGAYRFVHGVIREVVEADLGAARRAVLHRRLATVLQVRQGEPPVEALAYHWARSGEQEQAAVYLEQAGDRAQAQGAHGAAEGYYRDLVGALDGLARAQDAAHAREKLGATLRMLARYDAALAELEQAAATYRTLGDLESQGRVAAQIGQLHVEMGTPEQGLRLVQPLVGQLAACGPSTALAALHLALAALFEHCGRYAQQLAAAEQAAAVARVLGDTRLLAAAHGARGTALKIMGRLDQGLRALQEALRLAESGGELGSPSDIELLYHCATAAAYIGQGADAVRYADRALQAAERLGDPRYIAWILSLRGTRRRDVGDWEAARTDLEHAVAMHCRLGLSSRAAWALSGLGRLHREEGAWEAATREVAEAHAIAERGGDRMLLLNSIGILAEIEICRGQPAAARARLLPLLEHQDMPRQLMHFVLPVLAWAHLELGETSEADELVRQIVGYTRGAGELFLLAEVSWLQALVAMQQAHWEEAEYALEEGLSLSRSIPFPYEEARSLQAYGLMHQQKGEPGSARERLEAALAIFRRLGARKDLERTQQVLATLG